MKNDGCLCFSNATTSDKRGRLAFKKSSGTSADEANKLIFKYTDPYKIRISFGWDSSIKDLDICSYWTSCPNLKVGYRYNYSEATHTPGYTYSQTEDNITYNISYSGDIRGSSNSEWVEIWRHPTNSDGIFRIHFNFYEGVLNNANPVCTVIATQYKGGAFSAGGVVCSAVRNREALVSDPSVDILVDSTGLLTGIATSGYIKLTFDANGGQCDMSYKRVPKGGTYGVLPTPLFTGYTFTGWYTQKTGGSKISSSTVAGTSDTTVYARWTSNT